MSWNSPFSLPGQWFKGNLHTHTTQSDGQLSPEEAIAWYRGQGYDFVAITDHWVFTPGQSFAPASDFTVISGVELHGPNYHMLALGGSALPDRQLEPTVQELVDAVLADGALPFIAHPYWTGQSPADVAAIHRLAGIEVFNSVCEKMNGLGHARIHWDNLLSQGTRVWGLAVDDVHWRYGERGMGYIMVKTDKLDEPSLLEAIRQGHFYASTGPTLLDLRLVTGPKGEPALRAHCSPCHTITFHAAGPNGRRFEAEPGETISTATWSLRKEQIYLRVECCDARGRVAWSNPVFIEDVLA